MRACVVLSSGGSAFRRALDIAPELASDVVMITDRECDAEQIAATWQLEHRRIIESDRFLFSKKVAQFCKEREVNTCLLMFSRLIDAVLFESVETFNIHPSLLPLFPGISPLKQLRRTGMLMIGATLHRVDESIDGGPIVSQIVNQFDKDIKDGDLSHLSFMQKSYLALVFFCIVRGTSNSGSLNVTHRLEKNWYEKFLRADWRIAVSSLLPQL